MTSNFFTQCVEREGSIIPRRICRDVFEKVGFKLTKKDHNWYSAELPTGWSFKVSTEARTLIYDEKKRKRGIIVTVVTDGCKMESTYAMLYPRYEVEYEYENSTKKAILYDRATGKRSVICQCSSIFSDLQSGDDCISMAKMQMSERFPGWNNVDNWDENPASVIFA